MFKYLIAKCPITGGKTSSDWWLVLSRHHHYIDCLEVIVRVSKAKKEVFEYRIFHLSGYLTGQQFNIKTVKEYSKCP